MKQRTLVLTYLIFLFLINASARKANDDDDDETPRKKGKLPPPHLREVDQHSMKWQAHYAPRMNTLMQRKSFLMERLEGMADKITGNPQIPLEEKKFKLKSFEIFTRELNATEKMVVQALQWLERVLDGDYKTGLNIVEGSKQRLETLRDAALQEELEHNALLKAGEELDKYNQSSVKGLIDGILQDVAVAADQLEENLDEHIFNNAALNPKLGHGSNIEAVIRLEGGPDSSKEKRSADTGVIKLVDAEDNQFVLTRGKDSTIPHEDHQLIQDLILIIIVATLLGWACTSVALPPMFGYIIAGVILGPSGLNLLKSLVQIETIGDFGVFFILLAVGLEFSPTTLKRVLKVATLGTSLMIGLMVLGGLLIGRLWSTSTSESIFVAACLSLSSTPLVVKFLTATSDVPLDSPSHTDYGIVLLGILIMQDVFLGMLIALLPNMVTDTKDPSYNAALDFMIVVVNLISSMVIVACLCYLMAKFVVGHLYKHLVRKGSKEITVLASVCLAFFMLLLTNFMHVSMELGCFLAGVIISAQGHGLGEEVEGLLQPIKDLFAAVFFASIGLHVFPQFLAYEMTVLTTLTMATVGAKYIISVVVLAMLVPRSNWHVKWIASAGLAQVSEYSFVLGCRARRLGLITREVYLLILAVTTLSLLFAPVLWKLTLWQLQLKPKSSRTSSALHASTSPLPAQVMSAALHHTPSTDS